VSPVPGMRGRDVALATLLRGDVAEPCINYSWMTSSSYLSRAAGRDYWSDPEGVFYDYLRHCGINLVPQWYFPGEAQRNIERGVVAHEPLPHGLQQTTCPEDVVRQIEALPDEAQVERDYDVESVSEAYARPLLQRMARAEHEVLFIDGFGQADFMGGYTRWGYEPYLMALVVYPEAMQRYYHHSALVGRLQNEAIVLACRRHSLAPFVYSGQDICAAGGPIPSPAILRRVYFPELKWCMEPLVANGIGGIWHCDGNINPILPDLLDLGIAGLQGFEEEHGVDYEVIVRLWDRAGRPLIVLGCVSVVSTLPHGTVADVRRAVERSFTAAGRGRGFVLSSTSSVMPEVPHANIDALFEHGRSFGREFLGG